MAKGLYRGHYQMIGRVTGLSMVADAACKRFESKTLSFDRTALDVLNTINL